MKLLLITRLLALADDSGHGCGRPRTRPHTAEGGCFKDVWLEMNGHDGNALAWGTLPKPGVEMRDAGQRERVDIFAEGESVWPEQVTLALSSRRRWRKRSVCQVVEGRALAVQETRKEQGRREQY